MIGGKMHKPKRAKREQLHRRGDFWKKGMSFTEKDAALLQILIKRAQELGRTPLVREVPEAGKIKGRFRCWKDALTAAGLYLHNENQHH